MVVSERKEQLMAGNINQLATDKAQQILSFIRAGAFPLVAAEAAGVPREVYQKWIDSGESRRRREPYRSFARCSQGRRDRAYSARTCGL